MRLIDADICLDKAWQNFYKQEDEHEKNIDGYDIMRDRFYEQSGFECCQQTIVNEQPVEAILKSDYDSHLKMDMVAMFRSLWNDIEDLETVCNIASSGCITKRQVHEVIQEKINELMGE